MTGLADRCWPAQRVIYDATYEFDPPAGAMTLQFILRPLPRPGQTARGIRIATVPDCQTRRLETDTYGVVVETASIAHPLRRLQVNADWTVETVPGAALPLIAPRGEDLSTSDGPAAPLRELAHAEGLDRIRLAASGWIYDLRLPPAIRPLATLYQERRGGCEDVARLCADALRRQGVPVRFVVGYRGSRDASAARRHRRHAWLAIWSRDRGWSEIDPLNPDDDTPLLATAWGPALATLQPVTGTFASGKVKRLAVTVQVIPLG